MAKKRESRRQLQIKKHLIATVGGKWTKTHGGPFTEAGLPDLIGCVEGRFFGFEIKEPDGEASEIQLDTIAEYLAAGALAAVIETREEAEALVRKTLAGAAANLRGGQLAEWIRATCRAAGGKDVYRRRPRRKTRA